MNNYKEDGKEGTGACLTFDKNFFLTDTFYFMLNESEKNNQENKNPYKPSYTDDRKPLIWILYYNKQDNKLYYFPDKNLLTAYTVDLNNSITSWNNCAVTDKQKKIENRLLYSFKQLICAINQFSGKTPKQQEVAIKLLDRIRYYIKRDDFAEEKECRILELVRPSDVDVVVNQIDSVLYKNYKKIDEISGLNEIILGPKVANAKIVKELVKKEINRTKINPTIKISTAPLA